MHYYHRMDHDALPSQLSLAPHVPGLPWVGALPHMHRAPLQFLMGAMQEYGNVVRLGRIGTRQVFLISHPDDIKYVFLTHNDNFGKGKNPGTIDLLAKEPMALLDGKAWRPRRSILQPIFKPKQLPDYLPPMARATRAMLARWDALPPNSALPIGREMMRLTLDVIVKSMFNTELNTGDEALGNAIGEALAFVGRRLWSPVKPPLFVPTPGNRRFIAARAVIDAVVWPMIRQRRARLESGDHALPDMLTRLCVARDEETGACLTDQQIRDEVVSFFIAGHETTATALTWVWCMLSQHPDVYQRTCAEIDTVAGDGVVKAVDLANLTYTRMVIEETMRLYPPGWAISRQSIAQDKIGGYDIPAGSLIMVSPYVTHRRADVWDNPEGFDPQRFLPSVAAQRPRFASLPFGGGPYTCIAAAFAMAEAQSVVATVLQRYRLDLLPGQHIVPHPSFTLRPRHEVVMTLRARRASPMCAG